MNDSIIYLVRHGEPLLRKSQDRVYIGKTDIPLSPKGIGQAHGLSTDFRGLTVRQILCSGLVRTRQTAEIIASPHGLAPAIRPALNEIDLGTWEGLHVSEVKQRYPGEYEKRGHDIINYRTPGGESFLDCSRRVLACFFDIIAGAADNIIIIAHAGVNRIILSHALGLPLDDLFAIRQQYACINILHCKDTRITVKAVNKTSV